MPLAPAPLDFGGGWQLRQAQAWSAERQPSGLYVQRNRLLRPIAGGAGYTFVSASAAVADNGSTSSLAVAAAVNVGAGDIIIFGTGNGNGTAPTVATSGTATLSTAITAVSAWVTNGQFVNVRLFYCIVNAGGSLTITISPGGDSVNTGILAEFSGNAASLPVDLTNSATGSAANPTGAAFTPANGELAIGLLGVSNNNNMSPGTGWSDGSGALTDNNASNMQCGIIFEVSTGASLTPSWTATTPGNWAVSQASFKAAAGGAAFIAPRPLIVGQAVKRASIW